MLEGAKFTGIIDLNSHHDNYDIPQGFYRKLGEGSNMSIDSFGSLQLSNGGGSITAMSVGNSSSGSNDSHTLTSFYSFTSQKVKGEANISYISSRFYRAPELIFGATEYTTSIDIWSAGCVLAELLIGQPLFPGENAVGQLVEIIKVLGTPTREEIRCMNPNYTDFRFPQIKAHPWHKVFHKRMPPEAIDLASRLLQYSPSLRCNIHREISVLSYLVIYSL